jgi:hypothetical protein
MTDQCVAAVKASGFIIYLIEITHFKYKLKPLPLVVA